MQRERARTDKQRLFGGTNKRRLFRRLIMITHSVAERGILNMCTSEFSSKANMGKPCSSGPNENEVMAPGNERDKLVIQNFMISVFISLKRLE